MSDRFLVTSLPWLRFGVLLAVALPLGLFCAVSWMAHRDAERHAVMRLDDLTRVMEEHAERVFDTNRTVMREVDRVLGDSADSRIRAREPQLRDLLNAICERLPQLRAITVWGADGHVAASSDTAPAYGMPAVGAAGAWRVSPLAIDDTSGEAYFRISQPRRIGEGGDGGVLELAVRASYFTDYYRRLGKPEDKITFNLLTGDGYVVAHWPGAVEPGQREQRERHGAFRSVGNYGLFVSASQPPEVVFEPWRQQTAVLAAIAFPSAAALLYASLLALRRTRGAIEIARRLQEESAQRLRAEEALRHSQKMEALGELTGGVAHDFNNLMMVVSNNAYLLSTALPEGKERPELASIFRAVESGARLTRQLLAFARRQPLHPEVLELQRALPGMADLIRSTAGGGVSVGLHVAPDTPPVLVDPAELEMALINLAANARDAMNRSGALEIVGRASEPGEGPDAAKRYAIICVSDSGHGIKPENLQRVFDPFFTTKPVGTGTGLGLSQVYGFCHQAGGGVQLESEVGIGTTVSLFLPATERKPPAGANGTQQGARLEARVLLVEDDADVSSALASILRGLGSTVTAVSSADEAEALLVAENFDAVLSDIVVPGRRDGIALALALRARKPRIPAVLMTGYARETERAQAAGIEVLRKPCAPDDVARALRRALGNAATAASG